MSIDDDERAPSPAVKRRSSTERHERVSNEKALSALVESLGRLKPNHWAELEVPELVQDALADLKLMRSAPALERQLKFTRGLLRNLDWQALVRRVDLLRAGYEAEEARASRLALEWCHELVVQGDVALHRFLERFPEGDRRRLRQLVQNVIKAPEQRRAKQRHSLEQAVEAVVRNARAADAPRFVERAGEAAESQADSEPREADSFEADSPDSEPPDSGDD
ncbi:MAG TPA: DUF615 domain-containing protein [Polyangiaceae bacterium]|nr:DUF615 domain-containing protein [Polyangiaceae bacterium]